ncbi:MAG TPA: serine hydrolase [Jatrophihabitans sp.]|nr:serine hydrolase [Jatrophihabitans sp.]
MTQTLPPSDPSAGFGPPTVVAPARRRRLWLAVAVLLVAALATVWTVHRLLDDTSREYLSTDGWPTLGQGAYQVGDDTPRASADEHPVPIASVAKVMTALVVLEHRPLDPGREGPTLVVTGPAVVDTEHRRGRDESLVPVELGERLTERDALMALMLPSANNIADLLARYVSGSVPRFVAEMNRTARALGMKDTTYTDPSGFDPGTVSTALDQLRLAKQAAKDDTLAEIMRTRSYRIPVAGRITNTDTLLGQGGFVGMKTGSDDAAGGCFMFRAYRSVDGVNTEVLGVVLGQHGHNLITAGLYAAKQLVDRVAPEPAHP